MRIALVGGTHGNEPVGIEVMSLFRLSQQTYKNDYQCFWGNPKAFELKKRYVDSDLNRAFGEQGKPKGYEKERAEILTNEIQGHFDFCIDLHTTTSNMGCTAILNNTHPLTQKAALSLKKFFPKLILIEEKELDHQCNHLNCLCPAGLTIEVGPVANNVINADLVLKTYTIVEHLLNFNFADDILKFDFEVFKMLRQQDYPNRAGWYVHPQLEGHDFIEMKKGFPWFINIKNEVMTMEEEGPLYPFFVNEAAYLENKSAFLIAEKKHQFSTPKN